MSGRPKLGELLLAAGAIDEAQLEAALAQHERVGRSLGATLLRMGHLDEETLVRTLARQLGLPVAWLRGRRVQPDVLRQVPKHVVAKYRCLPVHLEDRDGHRSLLLALPDPSDAAALDEVALLTGLAVKPVLVAPSELRDAIRRHYPGALPETDEEDAATHEGGDADVPAGDPELVCMSEAAGRPAEGAESSSAERAASDIVVCALSQLLVEKGVLSREELVARIGALGGAAADEA